MFPTDPIAADDPHAALLRLVRLRWVLLGVVAFAALVAHFLLGIRLPLLALGLVLGLLAGSNIAQTRRAPVAIDAAALFRHLLADVAALGVMLFLAGGAANPLVSLLLLPVAAAALTLGGRAAAAVAVIAIAVYSVLSLWFLPLPISDPGRATRLHLAGMWLTFVVSVGLIVWLIVRIMTTLRSRDAALAVAREQALRDERVVAMGTLAAGAAHELGTPLATMAVIASEAARDAALPAFLREDMALLCQQIEVCKKIVGGLAARAGAARAEATHAEAADVWLRGVLARWGARQPRASATLECAGLPPAPQIVTDATLEQALGNLLDNAARESAAPLALKLVWNDDGIVIELRDNGPGFPQHVLDHAGRRPLPSAQGNGVGLMLSFAAIERLGGRLQLSNPAAGGALARIEFTALAAAPAPF